MLDISAPGANSRFQLAYDWELVVESLPPEVAISIHPVSTLPDFGHDTSLSELVLESSADAIAETHVEDIMMKTKVTAL
jgi:hypothetical protein